MRTFELDLNKLSDNELEALLALKKKAGSQMQILREEVLALEKEQPEIVKSVSKKFRGKGLSKKFRGKGLVEVWVKRVEKLESFLKKPRKRMEMFNYLKYELKGGGDYKTLVVYLKKVYGRSLMVITQGKTKFYYLSKGVGGLPKFGVKSATPKKELKETQQKVDRTKGRVDWTKEMESDLLDLKHRGLHIKKIKRNLDKKYNMNLRIKQVEMKAYNLKVKGKRTTPIYVKKHKIKYMKRKTPYIQLQSKYLKKVMEAHHMNSKDAMRYLATKYMENDKSARKAGQQVKAEIERRR